MHKANGFTRQQILTAVKMNGPMTADELGRSLGISPVAARQHLTALEAEGIVATRVERRGLGRPVHRYLLTERGDESFPRAYDTLLDHLLEELRDQEGEAAVDALLTAVGARRQGAHRHRLENRSLPARLEELAAIQNEQGYMARLEAAEDGYLLIQHNCAICRIARNHPVACENELARLRVLVGDGSVVERIRHIQSGDTTCTFLIRERGTE